jgi:hypothetical protein
MNCSVCGPRSCAPAYLYVVHDARNDTVKVGCTRRVSARMAQYRANGATHMTLRYSRIAGCHWSALDREQKALRHLAKAAPRVRGDWFATDAETARASIDYACANYRGARFA